MTRKVSSAICIFTIAAALAVRSTTVKAEGALAQRAGMERVLQRVRLAFDANESCIGLFTKYPGDPRKTLEGAVFVDVGDDLKPLGFAAATAPGTNRTLIGNTFYENLADIEGLATLVIHELLHQQGAGSEIDNYIENYEQISRACGTRNSAI